MMERLVISENLESLVGISRHFDDTFQAKKHFDDPSKITKDLENIVRELFT